MLKYEVVIFWSDEDELYVTYTPELPGCMAHGDTYGDALKNIIDAMDFWIETAREIGKPTPRPKVNRISFDLHKAVQGLPTAAGA